MSARKDWVALAERALERMLSAKTRRTEAKWYAVWRQAERAGARQEKRDQERAQKTDYAGVDDYDLYGPDDYYEVEIAFDY